MTFTYFCNACPERCEATTRGDAPDGCLYPKLAGPRARPHWMDKEHYGWAR